MPARADLPWRDEPGKGHRAVAPAGVGLERERAHRVARADELPRPGAVRLQRRAVALVLRRDERARRDVRRDEGVTVLQRQAPAHGGWHPVGARAEDRARLADRVVAGGDGERLDELGAVHVVPAQPALVGAQQPAEHALVAPRAGGLDVVEHLPQRPELVEVATQEVGGGIVMRVHDGGFGVEDLRVTGLDQLTPEQLVLGVGDLAIRHALEGPLRHGAVDVGEERPAPGEVAVERKPGRRAVEALHVDRPPIVAPRGEVALHLALDHVTRVGARDVRAEDGGDVVGDRESLEQRREPARRGRRRVLRDERDVLAARHRGHAVTGAAVGELALGIS